MSIMNKRVHWEYEYDFTATEFVTHIKYQVNTAV